MRSTESLGEVMYNQSSVLITMILFVSLVLAIEAGYRIGRRSREAANVGSKSHVNAIQASLLSILLAALAV